MKELSRAKTEEGIRRRAAEKREKKEEREGVSDMKPRERQALWRKKKSR